MGNFIRTYEKGVGDKSIRTELTKKQSIPQVCSWGMGFLETPINKMPVKEFNMIYIFLSLIAFLVGTLIAGFFIGRHTSTNI